MEKVVKRLKMTEQTSDSGYWQTRSFAERLAALEDIRREYNSWKYSNAEQRFQRVYRITQLKRS